MRFRAISLLAFPALFLAACSESSRQESSAVLFEGATLITGEATAPVENAAFLMDGGKFTQVGRKGEVAAPPGATRVDLTGKTVIPAIIDSHAHLGWAIIKTGAIGKDTYSKENLIDHLNRVAAYGVAFTRNLGIDPGEAAYEIRANPVPGAALLRTAGRGIAMPNAGPGQDYWRPVAYGVTTDTEARKAVQELAAKKADIVKIWVDDRNGTVKKLTPALYRAIIDEAHKNNLHVIAHIFYLADAKDLLRAGIDAFAHGVRDRDIDDEFVQLLKEHPNVYVIPNLPENATEDKKAHEFFGIQARNLAKVNAAGVKIAFGTDSGVSVGGTVHSELADMVTAGMTPMQVLTAATKTSAEILGLDQMGTIAAGKRADFIVLDANPLDDITNTRKIARVFLGGSEVDRSQSK